MINTTYMTNSTLVSPVKMEYGWNVSISGLKMMMKSGLGKIFLKFLHALTMLFLLLNLYFWSKFSNKNDMVSAWRNFKNIFPRPLLIIIFRPEMLKFHPYSILTGDSRVEFFIYRVLSTLVCRIDVHARLLILRKKFPLHGLIWPCTFIVFEKKIPLHVYFSAFIRVFALHVY